MSAWIISVVGIILLTTVVGIIMPDGRFSRYIKSILTFATILVIISPLKNIVKNRIDFTDLFGEYETQYQQSFLYYANEKKADAVAVRCVKKLEEIGMTGEKITVLYLGDVEFQIEKVQINVKNLVCNEDKSHMDRNVEIQRTLAEFLEIEIWQVEIYE